MRKVIPYLIREHYGEARRSGKYGGCTCMALPSKIMAGQHKVDYENCPYHRCAREFPLDHAIPWNCPTYYDGCNCVVSEDQKSRSYRHYCLVFLDEVL